MIRRREFITLLGGAAAWPLAVRAQTPAMPVIGFLSGRSPIESAYLLVPFRQGLIETGYVEAQNVAIEYRWAEGDLSHVPMLAAELAGRPVGVIAAVGGSAPQVIRSVTAIPIVCGFGGDPVEAGLLTSFNRPSGNATGVSAISYALEPKRLELLTAIAKDKLIGVLLTMDSSSTFRADQQERDIQAAAQILGVQTHIVRASNPREIDLAFRALERVRAGALLVSADAFYNSQRDQLVVLSAHYRIPAIYHTREFALAGGLMSYGASIADGYRIIGGYVGRILKGAKIAELPVQQPTRFEFIINLKTAKALGLTVPDRLLALADEVIE
jgi:putative ABC transport system substrate-binding protein